MNQVFRDTATDFAAFHACNPHVYDELVALARRLRARGIDRYGIAGLFEVLRYDYTLRTGGEPFKLNNSYRAYYARMIMANESELAGLFELRTSAADLQAVTS